MDPFSELLANLNLLDLGASGLLVLVVLMILTGRLVPKSVADVWRTAHAKSEEASRQKDSIIAKLVEANTVGVRVLDSLPSASPGGEPDVEETTQTRRRRRESGG